MDARSSSAISKYSPDFNSGKTNSGLLNEKAANPDRASNSANTAKPFRYQVPVIFNRHSSMAISIWILNIKRPFRIAETRILRASIQFREL